MNAVIYARYSSGKQTDQSIEGQLRDCYAFAEREGYTVIREYIDRALTGRSDDRPQFQQMIADAAKRQFGVIIVWKLDRFSRNRYDSAMYKARLKKYGVRVVSATENISDAPEGIILEGMLESLAEYYSANLANHVKRGMRESAMKGNSTGGSIPFGFRVENKRFVTDEERAPFLRYAFAQYADGVPLKDILDTLTAKGVRTRSGKPLSYATFHRAFHNKRYLGIYTYNGIEIPGGCDMLIDEETFQRVQRRLEATRRAPAARKAVVEYLLSGKVFCGMCGAPIVGESGRGAGGSVYNYYTCANRKKHHSCKKKNEKKGYLEWYIVEQTVLYVLSPERIDFIAEKVVELYDSEFGNDHVKELERRVSRLNDEIQQAIDASLKVSGKLRERYYKRLEELQLQLEEDEADLARLRLTERIPFTAEEVKAWMRLFCNGDPLDFEYQRRIIDTFVQSVYLYDDKLEIYYNLQDGKQISYIETIDSAEEPPFGGDPGNCNGVRISLSDGHQLKRQRVDKSL